MNGGMIFESGRRADEEIPRMKRLSFTFNLLGHRTHTTTTRTC